MTTQTEATRTGLIAIKTLLSRDPCIHARTAIQMIDAILAEQLAQQEPTIYVDPDAIRLLLDPDYSGVVTAQLTRHKPDPLRGPKVGLSITKGST